MLRTLVLEDMIFGIFPLMRAGFSDPWYHNVEEVFDAVLQVLKVCNIKTIIYYLFSMYRTDLSATRQGFEFIHHNLVAHRDVGSDNILINLLRVKRYLQLILARDRSPFGRVRYLYFILSTC